MLYFKYHVSAENKTFIRSNKIMLENKKTLK